MGISSIYIMDQKGRVLISRAYRADVPYRAHEIFQSKLIGLDELSLKPIIVDEENQIVFMHLRHQNIICIPYLILTHFISFDDYHKRH